MTRSSSRRRAALTSLACLPLLLSACDNNVNGNPQAATSASGTASVPTSPATGGNPFAGLSACTIVDQAMAGEGFPAATPSAADRFRSCASNKPGDANVGVALQDGEIYDQNVPNPSKASRGHVAERNAIIEREPIGAVGQCSIVIEVKPSSRVLVSLSGNDTTEHACDRVTQIAIKVEKLLPPTS